MKPLRTRLINEQRKGKTPWHTLERDYLQSWILSAISQTENLHSTLVFKGGTALKKCYFGDYRFSEDLDFSALPKAPQGNLLEKSIQNVCELTQNMLGEYTAVTLSVEGYREREPHPEGQEAFTIRCQFPWQREPICKVLVEITRDESLVLDPIKKPIIHKFGESIENKILVYSLEEIVIEKLRAILQHTKKLHEREWGRSRARDYYDLWRISESYGNHLQLHNLRNLLEKKCASKNVSFVNADSFFEEKMVQNARQTWEQWLSPLMPDLPECEMLLRELKQTISELLKD